MIRESDRSFVASALYVAAERYREDAKTIRESTMNGHPKESLAKVFEEQADRATAIANEIEE